MALEDFTTYNESDPQGKITVTSTKIDVSDFQQTGTSYVVKDKGADFFDALNINFEMYVDSTSDDYIYLPIGIGNAGNNNINNFASTDFYMRGSDFAGTCTFQIHRGGVTDASTGLSLSTLYYCTISRAAGNDTVSIKIYSDSGRSTLVDTISVSGFGTTKWRYLYGFVNRDVSDANRTVGYIQNMEIIEPAAFMPSMAII